MSKDLIRNWWGSAWVEKMERLAEPKRFTGGEEMARTGSVQALRFDGRTIAAKVQARDEPLYTVRISFDPFSREQWDSLVSEVRDQRALASAISSGDLPLDLQTSFSKAQLRFMPERYVDLHLECPCPDWLKPCKHLVALWLKFARDFDRDPFLLFELRGLQRNQLLTLLENRRPFSPPGEGQEEPEVEELPETADQPKIEPLPTDPASFWSAPALPSIQREASERRLLDDDIFERLANWPGIESDFHQIYDAVYELASLIRG